MSVSKINAGCFVEINEGREFRNCVFAMLWDKETLRSERTPRDIWNGTKIRWVTRYRAKAGWLRKKGSKQSVEGIVRKIIGVGAIGQGDGKDRQSGLEVLWIPNVVFRPARSPSNRRMTRGMGRNEACGEAQRWVPSKVTAGICS